MPLLMLEEKSDYFFKSTPHRKDVIGSTANFLDLVRNRYHNHPTGDRWYLEDGSTILGVSI